MAKQSLDTVKAVFEALPEAILVVDYYGVIVMCNYSLDQLFGYGKNELIGQSVETLIPERFTKSHKDYRESYSQQPVERKMHNGYVLTGIKKDGTEFHVEVGLKPIKIGRKTLIVCTINELTTENTLELRFQKMIEDVQDYSILFTDIDGNITNWNKGVMRIKGYTEKEIIGKNFRIFYTAEDQEKKKPERLLEQAILEGRAEEEGWRVRKDGSTYWAFVSITAIQDDLQHFIGFSQVTRDLTQRKMADELLKKQSTELKKKNKELEHFAYIASHDLQEPLSTVTSMIDLIREENGITDDKEIRTYFSFMEEAVLRMRNLVKGLLDYSRLGRNRKLAKTDVNAVLQDVQNDLATRIKSIDAKIEIGKMPVIMAFEVELRLVFQNLLINSLKFIRPDVKTIIKIDTEDFGRYWKFSIEDNGIGIKPEYLSKVFTIFQRLNERGAYEGTGIGLAHCKKVIEIHDGTIWATSTFGEGSTFYFTIPKQIKQGS